MHKVVFARLADWADAKATPPEGTHWGLPMRSGDHTAPYAFGSGGGWGSGLAAESIDMRPSHNGKPAREPSASAEDGARLCV